jgi:hypothetical protein
MTSTMQPDLVSAPAQSAPVPAPAAAKATAKRVARTPVKKTATPAQVAAKPVAKTATPKATVTAVVSTMPAIEPKAALKTPAEVVPKATSAPTAKPAEVKLLKAKKPKLVRDSFTIPKLEYLKLEELKHRSVKLGTAVKKSELIRAGIMALAAMTDANFMKATKAVPAIKTGRPAKD